MSETESESARRAVRSQAVIVITVLDDNTAVVLSYGSDRVQSREAEELADRLVNLLRAAAENPVPPGPMEAKDGR